jgi:hypothetical protein
MNLAFSGTVRTRGGPAFARALLSRQEDLPLVT